jgi:4-aminobutyrate aminotransferase
MIATTETKLPQSKEIATKFPKLNMPLPGPNAKRVVELDSKYVSPSYTRDYPLVAKRGHGAMI